MIRKNVKIAVLIAVAVCSYSTASVGQNAGSLITSTHGMVVSASKEASEAGLKVLQRGGNAVDAAVATGFALAVTYPSAGNIGGGSFILIRMADGRTAAIDARETAPAAAARDMFLDSAGSVIEGKSLTGPISAGVPGAVDGLMKALELFGTQSRQDLIAPAVVLASEGFPLHPRAAALFEIYEKELRAFPGSAACFFPGAKSLYKAGEIWRQPALARALQRIADRGADGFYKGETAECIVRQMQRGGGIITYEDLAQYRCVVREPVRGEYRGYTVLSMPPPSSGGIVLLEILNTLASFGEAYTSADSLQRIHLCIESMKQPYADRARYMGDPAYCTIPEANLLSNEYASEMARRIRPDRALRSNELNGTAAPAREGSNTTHYCVIDRWGNSVSVTTTINSVFGSKCVVEGAGLLLNNEMDDFSVKPGAPNQFGLTGNTANEIQPGKRMLSSMTPVIVERGGAPFLITGSPGGSTIITTVLHVLLNVIDGGMEIDRAISSKRFHHQWLPDEVVYEEGAFSRSMQDALTRLGHSLRGITSIGRAEGIYIPSGGGVIHGCSDPRGYGAALGY